MKILRYTPDMQKVLHTTVKSEPWLHVAIMKDTDGIYLYTIYVWDTREVIDSGQIPAGSKLDKSKLVPARDNHQPLQGFEDGDIASYVNEKFTGKPQTRLSERDHAYHERVVRKHAKGLLGQDF